MTIDQIGNLLSRARLVLSDIVGKAYTYEAAGGTSYQWRTAYDLQQLIFAMNDQLVIEDYTSDTTNRLYAQLECFVGTQFIDGATIDPNAQIPGTIVQIVNTGGSGQSGPPPKTLTIADFDPASAQEDGGCTVYNDPSMKGYNPMMQIFLPMGNDMELGTDYTLNPNGGFTLLLTGNIKEIYPNQTIKIYSYEIA